MSGTNYIASNWRTPENSNSSKNDNYSLYIDGSSANIVASHSTDLDVVTGNHSLAFWMKANVGTTTVVMEKGRGDELAAFIISNRIYWGGVNAFYGGSANINDNNWHHFVFVATGATSQIWIDGSLVATGGNKVEASANTEPFTMGTDANGNNSFTGLLSEVSIFNYALDENQITTLYGNATSGAGNPMALKPTPVGYWPLGDNSASDPLAQPNVAVEDASVFEFDGIDDYVDCGATLSDLGITGGVGLTSIYTLSCWVKFDAYPSSGKEMFFGASNILNQGLALTISANNRIYAYSNSSSYYSVPVSLNTWYFVAYTDDGTNRNLYINGLPDTTQFPQPSPTNLYLLRNVGMGSDNSGTFSFNGNVSNCQIWNIALEDAQIETLYNNGTPLTTAIESSNLKGWWKLDESANWDVGGSGNWTIPDVSGNGNDGTSSGMTSGNLVLSDLTRNLPYENYSLSFDSGVDYVECGNISGLNGGLTEATWSGWFNRSSSGGFYIMGTYGVGQIQFFVFQGNNYVTAYAGNSAGAQKTMSKANVTAWTTNQWYHFAFVYDESESSDADKMKIYIDGILQANVVAGAALTNLNSSTANFDIGRLTGIASTQFVGKISNVAIWNNGLSSTEVQNLYANGMPQDLTTFTPQPINWWTLGKESFWDGSDWVIRDMIGTNDGLSSNMGGSELKGDAPRSQANGVGTNIAVPADLKGEAGWSDKNGYSINMGPLARTTDTP